MSLHALTIYGIRNMGCGASPLAVALTALSVRRSETHRRMSRLGMLGGCKATGPKKHGGVLAGIRWGFLGAENDADACRSFAAAQWHDSDRLLVASAIVSIATFVG
jgi:hypothetical protein